MVGSHKVVGSSDSKTFMWPNGVSSGCFQPHISQSVAKSMPSLTSQLCGDSLLAVCPPGKTGLFIDHPGTRGRPTG